MQLTPKSSDKWARNAISTHQNIDTYSFDHLFIDSKCNRNSFDRCFQNARIYLHQLHTDFIFTSNSNNWFNASNDQRWRYSLKSHTNAHTQTHTYACTLSNELVCVSQIYHSDCVHQCICICAYRCLYACPSLCMCFLWVNFSKKNRSFNCRSHSYGLHRTNQIGIAFLVWSAWAERVYDNKKKRILTYP